MSDNGYLITVWFLAGMNMRMGNETSLHVPVPFDGQLTSICIKSCLWTIVLFMQSASLEMT